LAQQSTNLELEGPVEAPPRPSFEQIYAEYVAFSWRVLRHLGVPDASIDDAAQELWVVVYRRLAGFEGRAALRSWLFGIAINIVRTGRRSRERQDRRERERVLPDPWESARVDPLERERQREAFELVHGFLADLDEQRRMIFVSVLLEGMSAPEAAAALGLEVDLVQNRVRALRRSFKQWLERQKAS
jgi:RNA polymerase sigma-70 factor (ECF subfamily)